MEKSQSSPKSMNKDEFWEGHLCPQRGKFTSSRIINIANASMPKDDRSHVIDDVKEWEYIDHHNITHGRVRVLDTLGKLTDTPGVGEYSPITTFQTWPPKAPNALVLPNRRHEEPAPFQYIPEKKKYSPPLVLQGAKVPPVPGSEIRHGRSPGPGSYDDQDRARSDRKNVVLTSLSPKKSDCGKRLRLDFERLEVYDPKKTPGPGEYVAPKEHIGGVKIGKTLPLLGQREILIPQVKFYNITKSYAYLGRSIPSQDEEESSHHHHHHQQQQHHSHSKHH